MLSRQRVQKNRQRGPRCWQDLSHRHSERRQSKSAEGSGRSALASSALASSSSSHSVASSSWCVHLLLYEKTRAEAKKQAFSSVHPAIAAVLPVHRGSTLLPTWLTLISAAVAFFNLLYFAQPKWTPIRTITLINGLIALMALVQLLFVVIEPDNRTREAVLTICAEVLLIITAGHSMLAIRVLPPTSLSAYERTRHRSWARSIGAVAGVTLPVFLFNLVLFLVTFLLTWDSALRTHDASLTPPGILIDVKPRAVASGHGLFDKGASLGTYNYRVHLLCEGGTREGDDSGLTVVMESARGLPGTVNGNWAVEALANQSTVRICRWDRPGYGFSDNAPSSEMPYVAQALHDALHKSGELARVKPTKSLVLVGSGYGGSAPSPYLRRKPT